MSGSLAAREFPLRAAPMCTWKALHDAGEMLGSAESQPGRRQDPTCLHVGSCTTAAKPCRQLSGESLDHDHAADRGPLPDLERLRVLGGLVPVTRRGRVWELEDDDPPRRIVALQQLGLAAPGEIPPAMQLD